MLSHTNYAKFVIFMFNIVKMEYIPPSLEKIKIVRQDHVKQ